MFGARAQFHNWWNGSIGWDQWLVHPWIIQLGNSTKLLCSLSLILSTHTHTHAQTRFTQPQTLRLFSFFSCSWNLLIWPSMSLTLSLLLQFKATLHQLVPAGSRSAAPADLQLLSNTYCQASETCNLSFARRRPANSIHYINKKNGWCYT